MLLDFMAFHRFTKMDPQYLLQLETYWRKIQKTQFLKHSISNFYMYILYAFNAAYPHLKFTFELSENSKINYLDVSLELQNNTIIISWYRKKTWSGRYINFASDHLLSHKIGVTYSLNDTAVKLSHPTHHTENLRLIKETLLENGYPISLLEKKIDERYLF